MPGSGTGVAVDSLAALFGALHAVDQGERHRLLEPLAKKAGRPRTPFDERIPQGALREVVAYMLRDGQPSEADALREPLRASWHG